MHNKLVETEVSLGSTKDEIAALILTIKIQSKSSPNKPMQLRVPVGIRGRHNEVMTFENGELAEYTREVPGYTTDQEEG